MKLQFGLLFIAQIAITNALATFHSAQHAIEGFYIIELKADAVLASSALNDAHEDITVIKPIQIGEWKGFHVHAPSKAAVKTMQTHAAIESITQDSIVSKTQSALSTQSNGPWNLARISSRTIPATNDYNYPATAGAGTYVYVLDTGIDANHSDFGGRVTMGPNFVPGEANTDLEMHGTHVAGIVGGMTWGVAKAVNLVSIKVLDARGQGSWSNVLAGVSYVVGLNQADPTTVRICNLSLAGGKSAAINAAMTAATGAGVHMIVAAGNSGADACQYSPASAGGSLSPVIVVGATQQGDSIATFSNWGTCVDVFAPGARITSDLFNTVSGTITMSGTSMAAPHVAGIAALTLGDIKRNASPAALKTAVAVQITTKNVLFGVNMLTSPNRLAFCQRILGVSSFDGADVAGEGGKGGEDEIPIVKGKREAGMVWQV